MDTGKVRIGSIRTPEAHTHTVRLISADSGFL